MRKIWKLRKDFVSLHRNRGGVEPPLSLTPLSLIFVGCLWGGAPGGGDAPGQSNRDGAGTEQSEREMITKESIQQAAEAALEAGDLFLVEVRVLPDDIIEVSVDSDGRVSVEDCVRVTKFIENSFEEGALDDYSLTVSSYGIGQALKHPRQYKKLVGKKVDVVTKEGRKFTRVLEGVEEDAIIVEGERVPLSDIKTTKEFIDFK